MGSSRTAGSHQVRTAAALALLAVLALVALLTGCGDGEGASAAKVPPSGPSAFADEAFAELATDGEDDLWLAVSGYTRQGDFGLRVFRGEGSDWAEVPAPPGKVTGDLPVSIVVAGQDDDEAPCLGYSVGREWKPVVACLSGEEWQRRDLPALRGGFLQQIGAENGDLIALVSEPNGRQARYRLLRESGEEWTSTPPATAPAAIARLAIENDPSGSSNSPAIGLATQGETSQHYVLELQDETWRKLQPAVKGVGTGPLIGGPVVLPQHVLYPVTEADSVPWTFSVQSARIGSSGVRDVQLSTGAGNAQGQLHLVDDRLWATWQEDDPRKDGRFRASIYAAELRPSGKVRRKIRLWKGVSIGPGSTQIVGFQGTTMALYMRSSSNDRGLQATIRKLATN